MTSEPPPPDLDDAPQPTEDAQPAVNATQGKSGPVGPMIDDLLTNMIIWMAIEAVALGLLLGLMVSARFGMGVALGTTSAIINLVAYTYVVNKLLDTGSPLWVTAMVLKTFALFVVFGWLLKREYVDALPFVVGYTALPLGAVLGVLLPLRRPTPPPTG